MPGFTLQPDLIDYLLGLPDARWTLVRDEALNVLVETMRNPVRTENLDSVRQSLATLVSFSLTEHEAALVVGLGLAAGGGEQFLQPGTDRCGPPGGP